MIGLLAPVLSIASSALEGWQDNKKQKTAIKAAQAEAQIKRIERASFIPGSQDYVLTGWEYVQQAPDWYQYSFMGAVAASLGIRWAFKFFGGTK